MKKIFDVTGERNDITKLKISRKKAEEMGMEFGPGLDNEYFRHIYTTNSGNTIKKNERRRENDDSGRNTRKRSQMTGIFMSEVV